MSALMPATNFQHFDLTAALDRCCGDAEFLCELIDLFGQSFPEQWSAVGLAITAADAVELDEAAHGLKGVLSTLTQGAPYQLARELEFLGQSGSTTGAAPLAASLQTVVQELINEMYAWRKTVG